MAEGAARSVAERQDLVSAQPISSGHGGSVALRRLEFVVDLFWIVFAGGYCIVAAGYPAGGRFVPLTVGLAALAVGVVHFLGNFIAVVRPFTHGSAVSSPSEEAPTGILAAILWAAGLLAGIFLIGALPAIFLFFLLYFGLRAGRWLLGLSSAVVMTIVTWGLFGQLISLELPTGILFEYVLHLR
jgi:Tripartite tricarboxylate transporter TctB family